MMVKDIFGVPLEIGMTVAAATSSYRHTNLRVGKIVNITPKGNITIEDEKGRKSTPSGTHGVVAVTGFVGRQQQTHGDRVAARQAANTPW